MLRIVLPVIAPLLLCAFEWGPRAETLSEALRSGTPAEQRAAVESLSHASRDSPAWQEAFALQEPDLLAVALTHFGRVASDEDVVALAAFASHAQPEVRAAALAAWEHIRPDGSSELLIRAMSDADARVRAQAARSLAGFESDAVVRALELGLDDPDERVRTASVDSLGKARNELRLRALRKAASDPEPKLRSSALRALAHGEGTAGMIYQGVQDRDDTVRAAAVAALGNSSDPAAIELLATILEQDSATNSRLALEALLYHEQPAATDVLIERIDEIMHHDLIEETATALPHLSRLVRTRWRTKLAKSVQSNTSPTAHLELLVALARAQPHDISEAEGRLLELANRPGDAQLDALRLLGSCRSDRALVTLVRAIGSKDAALRSVALLGLTDFQQLNPRDERIADGLLDALEGASPDTRPAIVERIGATGASRLAPRLLPLLDLPRIDILLATLNALAKMPHPQSARRLRPLLAHSHARVRRAAAIALGTAAGADDRRWLQDQLMLERPQDRAALLIALREVVERLGTDDETLDTLHSFAQGERENLAALAAMILSKESRTAVPLGALLSHPSATRRALAATHLGAASDPASQVRLKTRARDESERTSVRVAALSALAMQAKEPADVPVLQTPWAVRLASQCARQFVKSKAKQDSVAQRRLIAMPPTSNTPLRRSLRALRFSTGETLWVTTDALGEVHLWNVPKGPIELFDPVAQPPKCE